MIIDTHCHVWEKETISDELRGILIATAEKHNYDLSLILNATPERLIKEMDEAGIDKAVILALDYEYLFRGHMSYKEYNDKVAGYVKDFP
ncbi:MAG: hypothetical protein GPJ52_01005, partial [Candidatus Heimdallarchaeota archaeon]|nr:hypothetical protein [Candidatus Heimdallarchaeota archaeon]